MKPNFTGRFLMAAAFLLGAGVAGAAGKQAAATPQTDAALANSVRHEIVMYPQYSIFDDVSIEVSHGVVDLTGAVDQPYKKADIGRLAKNVAGVAQVQNDIRVLPLSPNDDRLRLSIARAIYGDPAMRKYANEPFKPIHILVDNGHVTLTGMVDTELDKQIAGTQAALAGMSFGRIVNNLYVENLATRS
jgi:hyperosmotically inducible protein